MHARAAAKHHMSWNAAPAKTDVRQCVPPGLDCLVPMAHVWELRAFPSEVKVTGDCSLTGT